MHHTKKGDSGQTGLPRQKGKSTEVRDTWRIRGYTATKGALAQKTGPAGCMVAVAGAADAGHLGSREGKTQIGQRQKAAKGGALGVWAAAAHQAGHKGL